MVMHFDTKLAVILDEQLPVWQKANVSAFLISGIAATDPALVGEPYIDGSGNHYLPMCRQPIMIYAADPAGLRRAHQRALKRDTVRERSKGSPARAGRVSAPVRPCGSCLVERSERVVLAQEMGWAIARRGSRARVRTPG